MPRDRSVLPFAGSPDNAIKTSVSLTQQNYSKKDSITTGRSLSNEELEYGEKEKKANLAPILLKEFREFDKNGSGFITKEEIRQTLQRRGSSEVGSSAQASTFLKYSDLDDDGMIDYDEFVQLMTS